MLITSPSNDKVKELVKLKNKKYRDDNDIFFVEGKDLCDEAYNSGLMREIYILDGKDDIYDGIPYCFVSSEVMKKISDMPSITDYFAVVTKKVEQKPGNRVIILDNIQDPGNLGTIIRSATAFNFDTIILSTDTVDLYNPKVVRSTKGMLFNTNIIVRDLETYLKELEDYTIYGTDVTKGIDIRKEDIKDKIAIIIGNEGRGMSENLKKYCQKFLYIDMNKNCESLNAGVSASILMYEVYKKWNMS